MARVCVHCGRKCHTPDGGWASSAQGMPLCHPNEADRPDCYHMVTVYHHELVNCERCTQDPYVALTKLEMHDALLETLHNLDRMVRDALP